MSANDRQVGGTHYKASYIHWDFVLAVGMQYLEGNATKYLARWNKKGVALLDLEKALHYVEKLDECSALVALQCKSRPSRVWVAYETHEFCKANDISGYAQEAVTHLALWETTDALKRAATCIRALITEVKRRPDGDFMRPDPKYAVPKTQAAAAPVPLNDSNKHADRAPS